MDSTLQTVLLQKYRYNFCDFSIHLALPGSDLFTTFAHELAVRILEIISQFLKEA